MCSIELGWFHTRCALKRLCCTKAGGAEIYRNGELDSEKRIYPGGLFDPLGLTSEGGDRTAKLREAEIKHGGPHELLVSPLGRMASCFLGPVGMHLNRSSA